MNKKEKGDRVRVSLCIYEFGCLHDSHGLYKKGGHKRKDQGQPFPMAINRKNKGGGRNKKAKPGEKCGFFFHASKSLRKYRGKFTI